MNIISFSKHPKLSLQIEDTIYLIKSSYDAELLIKNGIIDTSSLTTEEVKLLSCFNTINRLLRFIEDERGDEVAKLSTCIKYTNTNFYLKRIKIL
jgi:hypothetical protein